MKQQSAETPARKWTATSLACFVVFGLALLVLLAFVANQYWNQPVLWIGLPVFYIAMALWLRSRLLVCVLAGLVLGAMLIDTEASGQSETYRIWQPVWAIGIGLLIGLIIGFTWDRAQTCDAEPKRARSKKRH